MSCLRAVVVFLLALGVVHAQIGLPRLPGTDRGPGLPIPGRGRQTKTPDTVLPSFAGTLKRLDTKAVVIELDDYRVLEFKRNDKTRFFRQKEEVKESVFKNGDHVSVEAREEAGGYMTAVNVYLEAVAETKAESAPPAPPAEEAPAPVERGTAKAPPPPPRDADDPGPPVLRRGPPPPREVAETAPAPPPPPARVPAPAPTVVERLDDERPLPARRGEAEEPVIRKAQEAALEFTETLPNYVCQEMVARSQSETQPANWHAYDVVTTDLVYEDGKESYRNLAINGRKTTKNIEETGSWSTGEFGTMLIDLFSPATAADFRFRRAARIAGADTRLYDFEVRRENSHWTVKAGSQAYVPAYSGSVWIDPRSGRVMRIEMSARNLPGEFPLDKVETAVDYENVRLATVNTFLLPVHAETLSCQRGSPLCSRNTIDFRNYRRYTGESSIRFEK
jgi:hypothetical protein